MGPSRTIYDLVGPETINMMELVNRVQELLRKNKLLQKDPFISNISQHEAKYEFDLADEIISVMECDSIGNNHRIVQELGIKLNPINIAIQSVIDHLKANNALYYDLNPNNIHGG